MRLPLKYHVPGPHYFYFPLPARSLSYNRGAGGACREVSRISESVLKSSRVNVCIISISIQVSKYLIIYLSNYVPFYLSTNLSIQLLNYLATKLSDYLPNYLAIWHLAIYLPMYWLLSMCRFIDLAIYRCIICLSTQSTHGEYIV